MNARLWCGDGGVDCVGIWGESPGDYALPQKYPRKGSQEAEWGRSSMGLNVSLILNQMSVFRRLPGAPDTQNPR